MESAAVDVPAATVMPSGTGENFMGRFPGESEEEYGLRLDAAFHHVNDAVLDSSRLTAACAGYDKDGAFYCSDSFILRGI